MKKENQYSEKMRNALNTNVVEEEVIKAVVEIVESHGLKLLALNWALILLNVDTEGNDVEGWIVSFGVNSDATRRLPWDAKALFVKTIVDSIETSLGWLNEESDWTISSVEVIE